MSENETGHIVSDTITSDRKEKKLMEWKNLNRGSIHAAVDAKSGGRADDFLNGTGKIYRVRNTAILSAWLKGYAAQNRPFTIVGDYDADGLNSTAAMILLLREIGATDVQYAIPYRPDGYGMSVKIVDEIAATGRRGVLITVDNGIKCYEAVERAKSYGFVVLVTDHHEPGVENGKVVLPKADLIVDPHVEDSLVAKDGEETNFDGYCGCGLVYKTAQFLLPEGSPTLLKIATFAAVATVADVVPLVEDNRVIYKTGVQAMADGCVTNGMAALLRKTGGYVVNAGVLGFKIGPMENALGRVHPENVGKVVDLLVSTDFISVCMQTVDEIAEVNEERKRLKSEAVKRAEAIIESECLYGMNPIVVYDPETCEGVVGLVAGHVTETYHVASVVLTDDPSDPNVLKGSCRAPDYVDVNAVLTALNDANPDYLVGFGGHKKAAGLKLRKEKLDDFIDAMQDFAGPAIPKNDVVEYDVEVKPEDLLSAIEEVSKYEPFGEGNPPIVVRVNDFEITPTSRGMYELLNGQEGPDTGVKFFGAKVGVVGFGLRKTFEDGLRSPSELDMIGTLSYNVWNGKSSPQVEALDFKQTQAVKTPKSDLYGSMSAALMQGGLM